MEEYICYIRKLPGSSRGKRCVVCVCVCARVCVKVNVCS